MIASKGSYSSYVKATAHIGIVALLLGALVMVPSLAVDATHTKILLWLACTLGGVLLLPRNALPLRALTLTTSGTALLGFFSITILSTTWSIAPLLSLWGSTGNYQSTITYLLYFCIVLLGITCSQYKDWWIMLVMSIKVAASILCIVAIVQQIFPFVFATIWVTESFLGRSFGLFERPALLAQWLVLALPFLVTHIKNKFCVQSILHYILIVTTVLVICSTGSKAAIIAMTSLLFCLAYANKKRIQWWHIGASIALILVGSIIATQRYTFESPYRSIASRAQIAQSALTLIADRPWGYGPATFGLTSGQVITKEIYNYEPLHSRIDQAHSWALDIALGSGILATIFLYSGFILLYRELYNKRAAEQYTYALALAGGTIAFSLDATSFTVLAPFWLIIGASIGSLHSIVGQGQKITTLTRYALIGVLLLILFAHALWLHAKVRNTTEIWPYDRYLLIQGIEHQLSGANTNSFEKQASKDSLLQLASLTHNYDSMHWALYGWWSATFSNGDRTDEYFAYARTLEPNGIAIRRIMIAAYSELNDTAAIQQIENEIRSLLPIGWNDPSTERGRILQKENDWLQQL